MKKWNRTGKLKTLFIVLVSIPNLFIPTQLEMTNSYLSSILIPLLFGSISIPLFTKMNQAINAGPLVAPKWNDPLKGANRMVFNQFAAFFMIGIGISMLIGQIIQFGHFYKLAIISVSFGIGMLIGTRLTIIWLDKKD